MKKVSTRAKRAVPVRHVVASTDAPSETINPDQDTSSPVNASGAPHEAAEPVEQTATEAPSVRAITKDAKEETDDEKILKDYKAVRYSFTVSSGEDRLLEELRQTHQIGGKKLKKNVMCVLRCSRSVTSGRSGLRRS